MAEVETTRDLLVMALQDLHDGERAMVERLGTVQGNLADDALRTIVAEDEDRSARQRDALTQALGTLDADAGDTENIWLRAILDDADNDAETIARGPLRDIAIAGALRKGKQSQRVSYETAIALARKLGKKDADTALSRMAQEAEDTDTALAQALALLSTGL
ncbi:DUF892 family protein [Altererythrobacter aerius]|uniref:DUF892 family protein n=1 Tax=Tsuneonella aeria TaxID=1837929 RepID=A0A6I4TJ30_9SPHN|nr:DUF892 family protein [Tsuneonella aeria]MXO76065.1 DUF892 family protein [Tsuneonella aeria]